MSNGSDNFVPSGNSAYSENHFLNSSLASHLRQNFLNAAVPAFPSKGQITTGTPFLLKNICRNGVPAQLCPCILVKLHSSRQTSSKIMRYIVTTWSTAMYFYIVTKHCKWR